MLEEMCYTGGIKYEQQAVSLITGEILSKLMTFFPVFCLLRHSRLKSYSGISKLRSMQVRMVQKEQGKVKVKREVRLVKIKES